MIIKGLFRRYERWNPVHPTSGAFWGMGIGIGCGVGWGPGFGPEVIGYVGAGCGVGFSVGFTLVGVGIGLPANFVFEVPYNAITAARSGALEFSQSKHLLSVSNVARGGWNNIAPRISGLHREARGRFSSFKENNLFGHMRCILPIHAMSISKGFERLGSHIFCPQKDAKD
ncbi:cadmium-induced protein AS8 isoform X2 [Tripterygium wilfordii]|uniref:cadmium-induced protein AS8 isoform X2 n=1 Tax=Tripterygium wilfordii TaxID=458696 RepID=UPI0018F803A9|nr:cadmium-induced protein AS8 isoform X2 [Tripterygium wilfordii]